MFSGTGLISFLRETLLFCVVSSYCLQVTTLPTHIKCRDLTTPEWTIERLGTVPIVAWPWRCLEIIYGADLYEAISRSCPDVYDAAARGFLGFVQYYVEKKGSRLVNDHAPNGTAPLDLAIANGHVDIAKYVAAKEALQSDVRDTALHRAARAGKLDVVLFLVERLDYDVDVKNRLNCSPSHYAVEGNQLAVLKYLIEEKGADVNARSSTGCSLLHVAAELGHLAIVKYLADERGLRVDLHGRYCDTPLFAAVWGQHLDTVKYLIRVRGVDVTERGVQNFTLLHVAAVGGDVNLMKYLVDEAAMSFLIDELDAYNYTAAMRAAVSGHLEVLQFLVGERRADIASLSSGGNKFLNGIIVSAKKRPELMSVVKYISLVTIRGVPGARHEKSTTGKELLKPW